MSMGRADALAGSEYLERTLYVHSCGRHAVAADMSFKKQIQIGQTRHKKKLLERSCKSPQLFFFLGGGVLSFFFSHNGRSRYSNAMQVCPL